MLKVNLIKKYVVDIRSIFFISVLLGIQLDIDAVLAESLDEKGFNLAARSDRSDRGFGDSETEMTMILRNAAGKSASRTLRFTTLEVPDESIGDKSLILFSTPRDIEGTALLSHAKMLESDDQWLYLPALKRVKRISSRNKSGPFVGSEFAFEDFTASELNKFKYNYLKQEACGSLTCDVIERIPLYENSGYTKQIAWVDSADYQLRKIEFYDRKESLLKELIFEDYRIYEEKYWRPHRLVMKNLQTKKSSDLIYGEYKFKVGLTDIDFVKGRLPGLR
jgi:outer membrane lipoprotein-sorting protein